MSKKGFSLISILIIIAAAYLLFFSGLMPKKTRIVFVVSEESIFEEICDDFNEENKDIKLDLIVKPIYEVQEYVAKGRGDIWIPDDVLALLYTEDGFRYENNGRDLYGRFTRIAHTPMIFVSAKEKYPYTSQMTVEDIYNNAVNNTGWDTISGNMKWGDFRFSCPNPYISEDGANFISLFIHQYYRAKGEKLESVGLKELNDEGLQEYISQFLKNISLTDGYSFLYDNFNSVDRALAVDICPTFEWTFFDTMKHSFNSDYWASVRIHYPDPTISLPVYLVVMKDSLKDSGKADAIKRFEDYMLSEAVQNKLVKLGYRPVNPGEGVLEELEKKYGAYGIKAELPEYVDPLDYSFIREFQKTMGRFVPAITNY